MKKEDLDLNIKIKEECIIFEDGQELIKKDMIC